MTRLVVSGGRYFNDVALLWRTLDEMHDLTPITLLVEGASDDVTGPYTGADYWAHQWALARQVPCLRHRADWEKHGKAAGPIRNGEMLKQYLPDTLITFPGGRGTANMTSQAEKIGGVSIKKVQAPPTTSPEIIGDLIGAKVMVVRDTREVIIAHPDMPPIKFSIEHPFIQGTKLERDARSAFARAQPEKR